MKSKKIIVNKYNFKEIEKIAIKKIKEEKEEIMKDKKKKEYICISMFPYPSGKLHIGHLRNYMLNDIICKRKSIEGYRSVMYFGWDAFGLPAEKASIKKKLEPSKWTEKNIRQMKKQIEKSGIYIDWKKEINTSKPSYYKHSQKIFNNMIKKGYIYKKKDIVNWDPEDKTVLANEQVINGKGWRSGKKIIKKKVTMYFIKVKKIINSIQKETKKIEWPEKIKRSQQKWIGKKKRYYFILKEKNSKKKHKVFCKKVISYLLSDHIIISIKSSKIPKKYEKEIKKKTLIRSKIKLIRKLPVGTQEIRVYYHTNYEENEEFNFLESEIEHNEIKKKKNKYIERIIKENKKKTIEKIKYYILKNIRYKKKYKFRIRDWSISRQRYWGTPIPIIKCKDCGTFITKRLPVKLPKNLKPTKEILNPLKENKKYKSIKCKKCRKECVRETETLDTFFDSSWYFIKYIKNKPFEKKTKKEKIAIDEYIGGVEHSILHLLYTRILTMILKKINMIKENKIIKKITIHGMVLSKTKEGKYKKMSKSKKNYKDPIKTTEKYGTDALRMHIFFMGGIEKDIKWSEEKITGCSRFIKKVWKTYTKNIRIK